MSALYPERGMGYIPTASNGHMTFYDRALRLGSLAPLSAPRNAASQRVLFACGCDCSECPVSISQNHPACADLSIALFHPSMYGFNYPLQATGERARIRRAQCKYSGSIARHRAESSQ